MHLLVVWIGVFAFGVLCAQARLLCDTLPRVFCSHCVWSTMYIHIDQFTFFIIYLNRMHKINAQWTSCLTRLTVHFESHTPTLSIFLCAV